MVNVFAGFGASITALPPTQCRRDEQRPSRGELRVRIVERGGERLDRRPSNPVLLPNRKVLVRRAARSIVLGDGVDSSCLSTYAQGEGRLLRRGVPDRVGALHFQAFG